MERTTEAATGEGQSLALAQVLANTAVPVYVITVEGGRVVDIRLATRDFITAVLAGQPGEEAGQDA
jgi:hypothetical protein